MTDYKDKTWAFPDRLWRGAFCRRSTWPRRSAVFQVGIVCGPSCSLKGFDISYKRWVLQLHYTWPNSNMHGQGLSGNRYGMCAYHYPGHSTKHDVFSVSLTKSKIKFLYIWWNHFLKRMGIGTDYQQFSMFPKTFGVIHCLPGSPLQPNDMSSNRLAIWGTGSWTINDNLLWWQQHLGAQRRCLNWYACEIESQVHRCRYVTTISWVEGNFNSVALQLALVVAIEVWGVSQQILQRTKSPTQIVSL